MKKNFFLFLISALTALSQTTYGQTPADAAFAIFKTSLFNSWQNDTIELSKEESNKRQVNEYVRWLDSLKKFSQATLSVDNQLDYGILNYEIKKQKWFLTDYKMYEWDPAQFNFADEGFSDLGIHSGQDIKEKLQYIFKLLEPVQNEYRFAMQSIKHPVKELTILAVAQNKGALQLLLPLQNDSLNRSVLTSAEKNKLDSAVNKTIVTVQEYISYLQAMLDDKNFVFKDFRLGQEKYNQLYLHVSGSDIPAKTMYEYAVMEKEKSIKKMYALSVGLWNKYFGKEAVPADSLLLIKRMVDTISFQHQENNTYIAASRKNVAHILQFIKDRKLLSIDTTEKILVKAMPVSYQRPGMSGTLIPSAEYDSTHVCYYYIRPLDNYSADKREAYLREFNDYIMQIMDIHEAVPGHWLMTYHRLQNADPLIKNTFNQFTNEGWAVYAVTMMMENGYAENNPELCLMYNKFHLRDMTNFIIDYGVQCNNMTKEEVIELLTHEAFQQKSAAEDKWERAKLYPTQLTSYFDGFYEIYALREEVKSILKNKFNLLEFHDEFLSYGQTPIKNIREIMLKKIANGYQVGR
jgi:hypothetical protein